MTSMFRDPRRQEKVFRSLCICIWEQLSLKGDDDKGNEAVIRVVDPVRFSDYLPPAVLNVIRPARAIA